MISEKAVSFSLAAVVALWVSTTVIQPFAPADGSEPELQKADPLLALKLRAALVPERVVNAITKVFKPLFFPPVVLAVLAGLAALDVWLFAYHGVAQSLRQVLYSPALLMMVLGLVILSAAFHECGHATACAYGGARPGVMGAGLYIVWPAFYTDVTDAYRLPRHARLRTDLGGLYFNAVIAVATLDTPDAALADVLKHVEQS